tara:strand:+ start:58805 stop:60325 length:1521 start_codon:yes stop_codon:yes gene_type:complete
MSPISQQQLPRLTLIRVLTVLISLLLSWLAVTLDSLPNDDTYTYLRAAESVLQNGIPAAYQHHQWANMSVLMAAIHSVTGLSLLQSAYFISAAMFALLSLGFVNLVAAIAPSRRVVWLAMLVIFSYPQINEFRAYIIRDIGFLAFSVTAIVQLIHYNRTLLMRHSVLFIASCFAAALFRPEALLFMFIAPVGLLMNAGLSENNRRRGFIRLELVSMLVIVAVLAVFAGSRIELNQQLLTYLEIYQPFVGNLRDLFTGNDAIARAVLGEYAAQYVGDYTGIFLLTGLLSLLAACIIDSLGLVVAPLLAYGYLKGLIRIERPALQLILIWAVTALFILLAFTLITRFITTRYTLLLTTVLLIFVPFIVDRAWSIARANGHSKRFGALMMFLLLFGFIDSHFSFGASKSHLQDGATWIAGHTRSNAPLLTNQIYLAYSSGRVSDYELVRRDLEPGMIRRATPGTIVAVSPRSGFVSELESEIARGALRLIHTVPAERGADLLIFEKELD